MAGPALSGPNLAVSPQACFHLMKTVLDLRLGPELDRFSTEWGWNAHESPEVAPAVRHKLQRKYRQCK